MTQLKYSIVKKIKDEPVLFGLVANALSVKPSSMPYILNNNTTRLLEFPVIKAISEFTGICQNDLVEEVEREAVA